MTTNDEHGLPAPWLAALPTELHEAAAEQCRFWDDPSTEAERQRLWDAMAELGKVQREIAEWEDFAPQSIADKAEQANRVLALRERERELLAEIDGEPGAHQGEDASPAPAIELVKTRERADTLSVEIDDLLVELQRDGVQPTAAKIMPLLKARAGQPWSCIRDVAPDGVLWQRGSTGSCEKLTMESLKRRIHRSLKGR